MDISMTKTQADPGGGVGLHEAGTQVFDTREAAQYLGCSAGHLKKLRLEGGGPAYHRLFRRRGIVYGRRDLDTWRASRRYGSTTEYPETLP